MSGQPPWKRCADTLRSFAARTKHYPGTPVARVPREDLEVYAATLTDCADTFEELGIHSDRLASYCAGLLSIAELCSKPGTTMAEVQAHIERLTKESEPS